MGRKVLIKIRKPYIVYSGSFLSQNYGEPELLRGFLFWDIKDKNDFDVKLIPITPVHPFFTLDIDNLDDFNIETYKFLPKQSRIRLRFTKEFDSRAIDRVANQFKNELETKEIITINDAQSVNESILLDSQSIRLEDLRNINIQENLIEKYLNKQNISDETLKKVLRINANHNDKIKNDEELVRNINWKIMNLQFTNTFSYKENNNINFAKLKGIIGIFGPNTIGKSSVIDTILYGMYNSNSKDVVKNLDVINSRKEKCNVKLEVEINKTRYLIDRTTTRLVAGKRSNNLLEHARTDISFSKLENSSTVSLNGLERADTDKNIRKIFGTAEDFLTTCVSAQEDMNYFIKQKSTRRKEIIAKFLDLDVFEQKYRLAKEESSIFKTQLKILSSKDFDKLIEKNKYREQELKKLYKSKSLEKNETIKHIKKLEKVLVQLNANYDNIKYVDEYYDTIKKINYLNDITGSLLLELHDLTEHKKLYQTRVDELSSNKIDECISSLDTQIAEARTLENKIKAIHNDKEKSEITHKQLEKSIKLLSDIPCGDEYPQCKFIRDSFSSKEKIVQLEIKMNEVSTKLEELKTQYGVIKLENIIENKKQLERDKLELKDLEQKINYCDLKIENKQLEIDNNKSQLYACVERKSALELLKLSDIDTSSIKQTITNTQEEITHLQANQKILDKELLDLSRQQGEISGAIKALIRENKEYKKVQDDYYAYELYEKLMSKSGIQQDIIKGKLSAINLEINKLLRNVVKFKVKLVDNENDKLDVYIDYNDAGGQRIIESASGAEKVFTSLAIRAALTRISTLPKPNIFIIDESFGVFDETNKVAVAKMLQLLKQYFNTVLVITHVTEIRDAVDWILTIERDQDRFSYLN